MLGATVLKVLWFVEGPGATRGEQQGPRGLLRVTLKVPFITVFMIPGLSCRDTNRTEMRDDHGGKIKVIDCVCVKYVGMPNGGRLTYKHKGKM